MGTRIEAVTFDGDRETAALPNALPTVPMPGGLTMLRSPPSCSAGLIPTRPGMSEFLAAGT